MRSALNDELDSNLLQFVTHGPRGRRYMAVASAELALVEVGAYTRDASIAIRTSRHRGDFEEGREDEEANQHEKFAVLVKPMGRSNTRSDFQKSFRRPNRYQIEARSMIVFVGNGSKAQPEAPCKWSSKNVLDLVHKGEAADGDLTIQNWHRGATQRSQRGTRPSERWRRTTK